MKKILIILTSIFILLGCHKKVEVANVAGERIFEKDVKQKVETLNPSIVKRYGESRVKDMILNSLVNQELIMKEIKDKGFDKKKEVLKNWNKVKESMSLRYFMNNYIQEKADIPNEELKKTYDNKKEKFKQEEKVKVRHILVRTGKDKKTGKVIHTDKEAKNKIKEIASKLKDDGSNFAEIAKKHSEGPSSKKGGDLGYFTKDKMVKPFSKAAFAMEKGEVLKESVKTKFGYHLIYVEDHKKAGYKKFDSVKNSLRMETYKRVIKDNYNIKFYLKKIKKKDTSEDTVVAEIKKLDTEYTYKEFIKELKEIVNEKNISRMLQSKRAIKNTLEQIVLKKAYENEMKEKNIKNSENYKNYMGLKRDNFLVNEYVNKELFNNFKVTDKQVEQFIKAKNIDTSSKRISKSMIKNKLKQQKRQQLFQKHVQDLKSQYQVNIKKKYSKKSKKNS